MEKLTDKSCAEFAAVLSSKSAVPGGGGASALAGALGAALGSMVGSYTVGKKTYAAVEPDILRLMEEADSLRKELLQCVEDDAAAFAPLSRAYGLAKDDPERDAIMEKCLRDAAAVPMRILELACRGIELQKEFAEKGSVMMASDAGTGAALCKAAMLGAVLNVRANTKLMRDRVYAARLDAQAEQLSGRYGPLADTIYEYVYRRCV